MPNVPFGPGVPALSSYSTVATVALVADVVSSLLFGSQTPQWGLFLNGLPIIAADSVISFDYKRDYTISSYPVEQGGFETYDKVQTPFEVTLRFATGGSLIDRQDFLNSIDDIIGDTNLYDAVTPERVYQSVNVKHQDYRRTANQGLGLLTVDIKVEEVRVTAMTSFGSGSVTPVSNSSQPSGASPVSTGNVSTTTPTPAQTVNNRFVDAF